MTEPIGFKERESVYEGLREQYDTPIYLLGYLPLHRQEGGTIFKYNSMADDLIWIALKLLAGEDYEGCTTEGEQVAYTICLKFGARWNRLERIAQYLWDRDYIRSFCNYKEAKDVLPPFPITDDWQKGLSQ